jgi:hypothetical protein
MSARTTSRAAQPARPPEDARPLDSESRAAPPRILQATLQLYRLFDLADALDLSIARGCLADSLRSPRPVVSRGASIEMPQLPLPASLGSVAIQQPGLAAEGQLEARLYDLGIVALALHVPISGPTEWSAAADVLAGFQVYPAWLAEVFARGIERLRQDIAPALVRPNAVVREEDYLHFVVARLAEGGPAAQLARHPAVLQAALGERKRLSAAASALATPLSYYEDDLIVLTWNTAIIVDPDPAAREDASLLLEFANAQLLAFRTYDARVDAELLVLAPRLAALRRFRWPFVPSTRRFLSEVHSLIADITDTSARVENALKVTEDAYWNRVYTAALAVLRVEVFRAGIADGVRVLTETASLLHNEAESAWTSLLEVLVIILIAVELVVAILGH